MPYDPFIFATQATITATTYRCTQGRSWEVHLPDQAPTEAFDTVNLFDSGIGVDDSDPATGKYFKTAENHPWALIITSTEEWEWPQEYVDIVTAFKSLSSGAESGGDNNDLVYITSRQPMLRAIRRDVMSIKDKQNREHHNVELRNNLSKENNMSAQSSWNMKKTMTVVFSYNPTPTCGWRGGGGGGDGGEHGFSFTIITGDTCNASNFATPSPSPVASAAAELTHYGDLVVPDGFDYSSVEQFWYHFTSTSVVFQQTVHLLPCIAVLVLVTTRHWNQTTQAKWLRGRVKQWCLRL